MFRSNLETAEGLGTLKEFLKMTPKQTVITGQEDKKGLATTLKALIEFYDVFNSLNLKKMA